MDLAAILCYLFLRSSAGQASLSSLESAAILLSWDFRSCLSQACSVFPDSGAHSWRFCCFGVPFDAIGIKKYKPLSARDTTLFIPWLINDCYAHAHKTKPCMRSIGEAVDDIHSVLGLGLLLCPILSALTFKKHSMLCPIWRIPCYAQYQVSRHLQCLNKHSKSRRGFQHFLACKPHNKGIYVLFTHFLKSLDWLTIVVTDIQPKLHKGNQNLLKEGQSRAIISTKADNKKNKHCHWRG